MAMKYTCEFRTGFHDTPGVPPALAEEVAKLHPDRHSPEDPAKVGFTTDGSWPNWVTPTAPGSALRFLDEVQFNLGELTRDPDAVVEMMFVHPGARVKAGRPAPAAAADLDPLDGLARFAHAVVYAVDDEGQGAPCQWAHLRIRHAGGGE